MTPIPIALLDAPFFERMASELAALEYTDTEGCEVDLAKHDACDIISTCFGYADANDMVERSWATAITASADALKEDYRDEQIRRLVEGWSRLGLRCKESAASVADLILNQLPEPVGEGGLLHLY